MSLVLCEECNKQISSTAGSCPYCGFKPKKLGFLGFLGYTILGIFVISFLFGKFMGGETRIDSNPSLPMTGSYICLNPKLINNAKSQSGQINDTLKNGIEVKIKITERNLAVIANVNGFDQSSKPLKYKIEGTSIIATTIKEDETIIDPTTKKSWISNSSTVISLDLKTGQLKRVVRHEHLNMDRKMTGFETFTLTAICPLI